MSLNAATIEILIAKGLNAADLLEVARATEVKADRTNAERQARHRAKQRNAVTVTGAAPLKEEIKTPVTPSSPSEPNGSTGEAPILLPDHVIEAWNAMADRAGLSKAKLTPERRRKLAGRLRSTTVDDWTEAIAAVERSSFCRGENDRGWRANFDFLLQPSSFTKLIEGTYDRSAH